MAAIDAPARRWPARPRAAAAFVVLGVGVAIAVSACGGRDDGESAATASAAASVLAPRGSLVEAADNERPASASAAPTSSAKAASAPIVAIDAGSFTSGSTPGDRGRDPTLEPALVRVELGAFDIDRLPYPNELGKPALRGVSRQRARELCRERGRRLCSELEWEHACKGPTEAAYATGPSWSSGCEASDSACASGFGVLAMGTMREWTASDVAAVGPVAAGAAVRGASKDAAEVDRRCAHRASVDAEREADDLGFRCCGGPENPAKIAAPETKKSFERASLDRARLAELLSSSAPLRKLSTDIEYFDPEAAPKTVLERGKIEQLKGYELVTSPMLWRPVPGEELVVVAARAGSDSLVVALHRLPDERYRLASSLVLHGDKGPIVLGVDRSVDKRLEWATCWACPGESGRIALRDDGRVVITQE